MFKRVDQAHHEHVTIKLDGRALSVPTGMTVAGVLLNEGAIPTRSSRYLGAPRAPYCMIGQCFECLVEIDGTPDQQSCMTVVRDRMIIHRQLLPRLLEDNN